MLVLSRKNGQGVKIEGPCEVLVIRAKNGQARLGFIADGKTLILRSEIEPHDDEDDGGETTEGGAAA